MTTQSINQFEKAIRHKFSCWKHYNITRSEDKSFVQFFISDGTESVSSPVLNTALDLERSFELMHCMLICCRVEAQIQDGEPKAVIVITINK